MKKMKHTLPILATVALTFAVSSCKEKHEPEPEDAGLLNAPTNVVYEKCSIIIDTRTVEEYDNDGHLPHALLIPHDAISEKITSVVPDKDTPIYVYCAAGFRAKMAVDALKKAGYTNVQSLGGLENASHVTGKPIIDKIRQH